MKRFCLCAAAVLGLAGWIAGSTLMAQAADKASDPALERARQKVLVADDLYKTAVVLVTENYVKSESDLAAGTAFKLLFKAMKEKGHHEARLIDATGEPYEGENVAADDFEKAAIKALKAGKPTYEQEIKKDGKRYLRMATAIPVVHKKCIMCHPAYENRKPGEAIGAIGYVMPIE
jgi:Flp pilus assembly protein CpaB